MKTQPDEQPNELTAAIAAIRAQLDDVRQNRINEMLAQRNASIERTRALLHTAIDALNEAIALAEEQSQEEQQQ